MPELVVTVVGRDRPGIIATVTAALADLGGNLTDSSMTILRGSFAMTLVVDGPAGAETVQAVLAPVCDVRHLHCSVAVAEPGEPAPGAPYLLSLHGGDRPGIVAAVTGLLARHGGNVTDLTTRLSGEDLYVVVAEVDLPSTTDAAVVQGELAQVCAELGVSATLRPVDADVL